jgi:hypothetical protein
MDVVYACVGGLDDAKSQDCPKPMHAPCMFRRVGVFMVLRMSKYLLLLLCLTASAAAEPVSFSREVLPLLSDNCLSCHGQDAGHRKADLRLDTQEGAREVLKSGDFIERIISDDPEEVMPPPKSHKPKLKAEQSHC